MKVGIPEKIAMLWVCAICSGTYAAQVDFETIPVGTTFGATFGQNPGTEIMSQDGILVTVERFFLGSFEGFIRAEIGGTYASSFATTPLDLHDISVKFDFSGLNFSVDEVIFEFQEFGGSSNFSVNGEPILELASMTNLPFNVASGVTATINGGQITLNGTISSFQIGGQEFAIDNVVAVPEPATLILMGLGGAILFTRRKKNHTSKPS